VSTAVTLRKRVEQHLNSFAVEVTLLVLIVASVVLTVLEVVVGPEARPPLMLAGDVLTAVFAVELSLRFWVARKKARFFERYWIDILAVLPLVRPLRFLRVLRVLRLFRAGMLFHRRFSSLTVRGRRGSEYLGIAVGTVTLVVMCAMVLYRVEGGLNPSLDRFDKALWYAALSLVGGEPIGATPLTYVGRWTTMVLMVGGLSLFGVFVGFVSAGMVAGLTRRLEVHELDIDELQDHVVVCGWNQAAPTVIQELFGASERRDRAIVWVTERALTDEQVPQVGVRPELLYRHVGDYTRVDVLEAVNVAEASSVVLLSDELIPRSAQDCDARTVLAALTVERMVPGVETVAMLHSRQNVELLKMAGVEEIIVGDLYSGMIVGSVQRNPGLVRVLDEILTNRHGNAFCTVRVPDRFAGQQVRALHTHLVEDHRALLVSVEVGGEMKVNPSPDLLLEGGERMVLLAEQVSL
jgi:voltage-gated potassium channel